MNLKTINDLLRSEEEARKYWKENQGKPYILRKDSGMQKLVYFGTYGHFYDPQHPIFGEIHDEFKDWIEISNKNRIVLVEGGRREVENLDKKSAMLKGESTYTTWLAENNKVKHESPEPSERKQREILQNMGYSKDEIQYYFFAITTNQYWDMKTKQSFEDYMHKYLEMDKKNSKWRGYDFSLSNMYSLHEKFWGEPFKIYPEFGIIEKESPIRKIVEDASKIRDIHIAFEISRYWCKGLSIFIVYGGSHTYIQEPIIKKL